MMGPIVKMSCVDVHVVGDTTIVKQMGVSMVANLSRTQSKVTTLRKWP